MKNKGFTLVELLAVLVIIGVISAISISIYTNSINESKKSLSDFQKKQLIESARTYVAVNTIGFNNIFNKMAIDENSSCVALQIQVLIKEGLISESIVDPKDTRTKLDGYIKIRYSSASSQYTYEYVDEAVGTTVCSYSYWVDNDSIMHTE